MAHIGRFYKLQFRRDLASTSNNNEGYPEAYLSAMEVLAGSLGNVISSHQYVVANLLTNDQPPMVWRNLSIVIGGTLLEYRVTITNPFTIPNQAMRLQWIRQIDSKILFQLTTMPIGTNNAFGSWNLADATPEVETPEIHRAGGGVRSFLTAAGWNVYNP